MCPKVTLAKHLDDIAGDLILFIAIGKFINEMIITLSSHVSRVLLETAIYLTNKSVNNIQYDLGTLDIMFY